MSTAILVTMRGLNTNSIEHIQAIEKAIDCALKPYGYARERSKKAGNLAAFTYGQVAVIKSDMV